jgi:hypothetical protein
MSKHVVIVMNEHVQSEKVGGFPVRFAERVREILDKVAAEDLGVSDIREIKRGPDRAARESVSLPR